LQAIHIAADLLYQNDIRMLPAADRRSRLADTLARRNGGFVDRGAIHGRSRLDPVFL
jgi:hypothetical protein